MAKKTIVGKLVSLTAHKKECLDSEYSNLQLLMRGLPAKLHSANKQQALRFYKKKQPKEYPLSIRNDLLKIKESNNKLSRFWVKIPVAKQRGGIWLAFKTYAWPSNDAKLCESKIVKKNGNYFLHLVIKKDIALNSFENILAIDLGEKHIATTVLKRNNAFVNPKFYGKKVRGIRRHYAWLRKRLGNKRLLNKIKSVGQTEKRKVNAILHKISKDIVEEAKQNNACIVLGNLKGIRNNAKRKGKRFNRIISNMPFNKLTQYIQYKAEWQGIPTFQISERDTSKTCHKCKSIGKRKTQGLFVCDCGLEYNADLNAVKNIADRFSEQRFEDGAIVNLPKTETVTMISEAP